MNRWLRIAVSIAVLTLLFLVLPWTDVRALADGLGFGGVPGIEFRAALARLL